VTDNNKQKSEATEQAAETVEAAESTAVESAEEATGLTASQAAFLAAYAETGNISWAARAAGISRQRHYVWSEQSEAYREAAAVAQSEAVEFLELEARKRAAEGMRQYKFHEGTPILHPITGEPYYEEKRSDTLLIFLLKALKPEMYRERSDVKMDVSHSGQVAVNVKQASEIRLEMLGDDGYLEYLRDRAEDADAGTLRESGHPEPQPTLGDGAAPEVVGQEAQPDSSGDV